MPNRYIRDAILNSRRFLNINKAERLLFLELLLIADDFGLVKLDPMVLRRRVTACEGESDEAISRMVEHLHDQDLIRIYSSDGSQYCYIPQNGFQIRIRKSKCPLPQPRDGAGFSEIIGLAEKCLSPAKHMSADAQHPYASRVGPKVEVEVEVEDVQVVSSVLNPRSEVDSRTATLPHVPEASDEVSGRTTRKPANENVRTSTGSRLPADWQPTSSDVAFCEAHGLSVVTMTAMFRDFWHAKAGADARKADWSATWRNWIRKDAMNRR